MFPSYGFSSLYPYQRGQKLLNEYLHRRWEAFPSHMTDAVNSPPMYEPWRHNYGHPVPVQCRPWCGSHHYPPSYCFSSPYPHFPSPPCYHHCCGGYPAYPESYAVHRSPSPHYTMEQPRYEYDKKVPSECRCCGCPNHPSRAKEGKNIKIEEQEAETTELDNCQDAPCIVKPNVWNGLLKH
ncbi:hypothetical protein Nepgr_031184 [Nepenthes gracilis]|uniref:Uncharacterized protein n=1 Tax=Nepenthes gracilis TaxID=150966 RepID=A0AAD3Y7B0_NEPGR|nr:hypothetical protein Nepgr_031184 [Nepenthes gracilis]